MLRKGGNAFDAAVATSLMLGVVEPAFSGIGGGGLALLHRYSGEDVALDYRETAPEESTPTMFDEGSDMNRVGPLSIATPGLLAGHSRILEGFGTMEFEEVARPAVEAAKFGVPGVSLSRRMLEERWPEVHAKVARFDASTGPLLGGGWSAELARTLSRLAAGDPSEFYRGDVPRVVSKFLAEAGGIVSEGDFRDYEPKARRPVTGECLGYDVVSFPPPSAGGALLIQGLKMLEELGPGDGRSGEAGRVAMVGEVIRSMLEDKPAFGDPDFVDIDVAATISRARAARKADEIRSRTPARVGEVPSGPGSTTHFSVMDSKGNAAAVTETIECYYGSGMAVPGLGIIMNDEMHDFDVVPGRANSVAPGKRPVSSMSPTVVLKQGEPFMVLGSAGAERIIGSVLQVAANVLQRGMGISEAVAARRVHPSSSGLTVEGGFDDIVLSGLKSSGYELSVKKDPDMYFGGVHAILADKTGKVQGAADPRRLGAAVVE